MPQPERIGRYRIVGVLGRGAMGIVYRGRDEVLQRDAAVKVLLSHADPRARRRFQTEARAAARLQHPNIVTVYEFGEHEDSPFLAMELLQGMDLQRAIEAGIRPDPRRTLPIVLQLLAGLGHAHDQGVVHRDVKPSNVFLPAGLPAKITDFGVARVTDATTGGVAGTPNYMSPEQARGADDLDGRCDLFSAGLILYELVTGERAFKGDSIVTLLYKITHEDPDLSLIPREWRSLRDVIARALRRDPAERYPDAAAMIADLAAVLLSLGGPANWATVFYRGVSPRGGGHPLAETPAPFEPAVDLLTAPAATEPAQPAAEWSAPEPFGGSGAPAPPQPGIPRAWLAVGAGAALLIGAGLIGIALVRKPPPKPPVVVSSVVTVPEAPPPSAAPPPTSPTAPPPEATPVPTRPPATPTPAPSPKATPVPTPEPTPSPTETPQPAPTATPETSPSPEATPRSTPAPTPETPPSTAASPPELPSAAPSVEHAESLLEARHYHAALKEARAVLEKDPGNKEARMIAEDAELGALVESCIAKAEAALRQGDKSRAMDEIRVCQGVAPNDARLIALWRRATQ